MVSAVVNLGRFDRPVRVPPVTARTLGGAIRRATRKVLKELPKRKRVTSLSVKVTALPPPPPSTRQEPR